MMENVDNIQAVIDLARSEASYRRPEVVTDHANPLVYRDRSGELRQLDLEEYLPEPRRARGTANFTRIDSLIRYINDRVLPADIGAMPVEVYVSADDTFTAVFNGETAEGPGWGDHRAVLTPPADQDWQAWLRGHGEWMSQEEFAEHVELMAHTFMEPSAADMLEIAQTFDAKKDVAFRQSVRLSSGEHQLTYEEQVDAAAGVSGRLEVPTRFKIAVTPFRDLLDKDGHPVLYPLNARFRFRLRSGQLSLSYLLDRPHDVQRTAVDGMVERITGEANVTILYGAPAVP